MTLYNSSLDGSTGAVRTVDPYIAVHGCNTYDIKMRSDMIRCTTCCGDLHAECGVRRTRSLVANFLACVETNRYWYVSSSSSVLKTSINCIIVVLYVPQRRHRFFFHFLTLLVFLLLSVVGPLTADEIQSTLNTDATITEYDTDDVFEDVENSFHADVFMCSIICSRERSVEALGGTIQP